MCLITLMLVAGTLFAPPPARVAEEPCPNGNPVPNRPFRDSGVAVSGQEDMEHSVSAMIEFVRVNVDAGLADQMEEDLTTPDACVEIFELWTGAGTSNATAIAVQTKGVQLWLSSIVLIHEYTHWTRARVPPTPPPGGPPTPSNPYGGDPDTADSNPCGQCNHGGMIAADLGNIALFCESLSTAELEYLCDLRDEWRKKVGRSLSACRYAGCSACCGFGYVPNVDQIFPAVPCCD